MNKFHTNMVVGLALLLLIVYALFAIESHGAFVASRFGFFGILVIGVIFFLSYWMKSNQEKAEKAELDEIKAKEQTTTNKKIKK